MSFLQEVHLLSLNGSVFFIINVWTVIFDYFYIYYFLSVKTLDIFDDGKRSHIYIWNWIQRFGYAISITKAKEDQLLL